MYRIRAKPIYVGLELGLGFGAASPIGVLPHSQTVPVTFCTVPETRSVRLFFVDVVVVTPAAAAAAAAACSSLRGAPGDAAEVDGWSPGLDLIARVLGAELHSHGSLGGLAVRIASLARLMLCVALIQCIKQLFRERRWLPLEVPTEKPKHECHDLAAPDQTVLPCLLLCLRVGGTCL